MHRPTIVCNQCIGNITKLIDLEVYNNFLTGALPSSLSNLVQITTLLLGSNRLNGTIPASLGRNYNSIILHGICLFCDRDFDLFGGFESGPQCVLRTGTFQLESAVPADAA